VNMVIVSVALAALITGPADTLASSAVSTAEADLADTQRTPGDVSTPDAVATVRSGLNTGTGFVIGPGEIVTAAHVIDVGGEIIVQVAGRHLDARLVAFDAAADLALLVVAATDLPTLHVAESLPPVGEDATAFSAADGVVAATRGIISAYETVRGVPHLRTDAAVNAGSSGGPIVDASGWVIGVTVTKIEGREGVAHAVTADVLRDFLDTRPSAAAPSQSEDRSSSALPLTIGGSVLLLGAPLLAFLRRRGRASTSQLPDDVQLGRSRIRLDADAMTHPQPGGNNGP
jgi:S1-C subfamily serine protease